MAPEPRNDNLSQRLSDLLSRVVIPAALLVFAAPFIALMFLAAPAADDFARAILAPPNSTGFTCVRQTQILAAAWDQYATAGGAGRWLTGFLQLLAMHTFGLSSSYGWLLLLVMLTNVAALSYFFSSLARVPHTRAVLAAGVFYAVWLASFPTPGDNIFWLTGAMEYQLSLTAMLILAGLLCTSGDTIRRYLVLAVLAVAVPAQHEIAGAFLVVCLLAGVVVARVLHLPSRQWLVCLALAVLSLAVIMLSPAMAFKFAVGHGHSTVGYLTQILPYAKRTVGHVIRWVLNPPVLLGALCVPLLLWADDGPENEYRPPRLIALAGTGALCVLLGEFAQGEMVTFSYSFPSRVVGWFQFVFLLLFICVVLTGVPEISKMRLSAGSRIGIYALFAASLLTSETFRLATRDVLGPARSWHRSNMIRLMEKGSVLQFDALPPKPDMFQETGLSKDPKCWVNQCMAVYLGANVVSLKGPKENHWDGGNLCDLDPREK
jgi:hypothetical protein